MAALVTMLGFLALFPLLLVLVTTLAFFLHDNATLRADLLDSALADFPVIGAQLRKNVHASAATVSARRRGRGPRLGIARRRAGGAARDGGGVERAGAGPAELPARIGRALLLLGVIGLGVVATTVLAGVATLLPESPAVVVLTVVLTVALNIALYLLAFRILTPKQVPTRSLRIGAVVGGTAWTALQALGGWLVARQLRHTSELYGFFGIVLGLLFFLFLAAQLVVYAADQRRAHPPAVSTQPDHPAVDRRRRGRAPRQGRGTGAGTGRTGRRAFRRIGIG